MARHFTEADAAHAECSHIAVLATATEAAPNNPRGELRLLFTAGDDGRFRHDYFLCFFWVASWALSGTPCKR